jgi:ribosomal protein S27E
MEGDKVTIKCPVCGAVQDVLKRDVSTTVKCNKCEGRIMAVPLPGSSSQMTAGPALPGPVLAQLVVMWVAIAIILLPGLAIIFNAPFNYAYFWVITFLVAMVAGAIIVTMRAKQNAAKQ